MARIGSHNRCARNNASTRIPTSHLEISQSTEFVLVFSGVTRHPTILRSFKHCLFTIFKSVQRFIESAVDWKSEYNLNLNRFVCWLSIYSMRVSRCMCTCMRPMRWPSEMCLLYGEIYISFKKIYCDAEIARWNSSLESTRWAVPVRRCHVWAPRQILMTR